MMTGLARIVPAAFAAVLAACGGHAPPPPPAPPAPPLATDAPPPAPVPRTVMLTVLGTSDLHGHIERLPYFAAYVDAARKARAADGGAVVLIDAGDMFQGTLESNLGEGRLVVLAYNEIGYDAAAIGNHEFDYGPAGPAPVPAGPQDDPQGALKARAAEAKFPFLASNLVDAKTGEVLHWPNVITAYGRVVLPGLEVGVVGVTTESTPYTTMSANFAGLAVTPLAEAIERNARLLRDQGAQVIVVAAHAGAHCQRFDDPDDLSSCAGDQEIFDVARALPAGLVDVIVAGHTHDAAAHRVNGIAIVQSWSYGRAFDRVDVTVDLAAPAGPQITDVRIRPPQEICQPAAAGADPTACVMYPYEGQTLSPPAEVASIARLAIERARDQREALLGVTIDAPIQRSYALESPLGNLFADLMRAARPGADVALINGGSLRADLPAGPLTYGALYEAMPFDNRFATVQLTGAHLRQLVADNLTGTGGFFLLSGVRARARCEKGALRVDLVRDNGKKIADTDRLRLVTSDFLATGGDGAIGRLGLAAGAVTIDDSAGVRDGLADALRARPGQLRAGDKALFDPAAPRVAYPGKRPVSCAAARELNR